MLIAGVSYAVFFVLSCHCYYVNTSLSSMCPPSIAGEMVLPRLNVDDARFVLLGVSKQALTKLQTTENKHFRAIDLLSRTLSLR